MMDALVEALRAVWARFGIARAAAQAPLGAKIG